MTPKDELHRGQNSIHRSLLKIDDDEDSHRNNNNNNNNNNVNDNDTDYENGYDASDDNDKKSVNHWRRTVLRRIKEWWKDEMFLLPLSSKSKWTAATAVLVLAAATTAYRRRAGRPQQRRLIQQMASKTTKDAPLSSLASPATAGSRRCFSSSSLLLLLWNALLRSKDDAAARRNIVNVSLSMLQIAARQGLVKKALVGSGEILYQDRDTTTNGGGTTATTWKRTRLPSNSSGIQADLLELLSQNGCDDVAAMPESLSARLAGPLLAALPFVYLALVYKIFKNIHNGGNDLKLLTMDSRTTTTRFTDVAGLEPIMPEVQEIVYYLQHTQNYRALGAQPPRGILLYGPPGAGKTLLARAVAGEANAAFCACSGSDFCEMYVGRGAARVRTLFERARSQALERSGRGSSWWKRIVSSNGWASKTPSRSSAEPPPPTAIIFIDEFDALAKSRSYGGHNGNDERESTLNQLLTEIDGFASATTNEDDDDNVTIIIIAATNRPDVLDPAICAASIDRSMSRIPVPAEDVIFSKSMPG